MFRIPFIGEKNALQHSLQSPGSSCTNTHDKTKQMETRLPLYIHKSKYLEK